MIEDIKIKSIMKTDLLVLHPKASIRDAENMFKRYQIHHIPIAVNNKLVGIVSLGDMLMANRVVTKHRDKFPANDYFKMDTVDEIMTHNPFTVNETDSITRALEIMKQKRINCLPVVASEKLVGIITSFDVINLLSKSIEAPCE